MLRIFCCFLLLAQVSACSLSKVTNTEKVKSPINVEFSSPKHIRFQGKGAGAGMALMSSMGPVGIAIGVAIDEGIAKDIRQSAAESGLDIDELVKSNLSRSSELAFNIGTVHTKEDEVNNSAKLLVIIKSYGFVIVDGNNDLTTAKWQLQVIQHDAEGKVPKITEFNFPDDYNNQPKNKLTSYPLEQVKEDGNKAILLLNMGLETIITDPSFKQIFATNNKK